MRTDIAFDDWTNVTTTSGNTLMSAEGDVRFHTVSSGGAAPTDRYDGHVLDDGGFVVVPTALDVYARSLDTPGASIVTTAFE